MLVLISDLHLTDERAGIRAEAYPRGAGVGNDASLRACS